MYHHRWVQRCLAGIAGKTKEKLHVSIFSDLLDGLPIGQAKPLLDEQRSKRQPHWLRRGASRGVELRGICFFQCFPWHQRREDHPAVLRVQRTAKRHMELIDCQLAVMVYSVHLLRSEVTVIFNCPDRAQFTGSRSLKQAAPQSI